MALTEQQRKNLAEGDRRAMAWVAEAARRARERVQAGGNMCARPKSRTATGKAADSDLIESATTMEEGNIADISNRYEAENGNVLNTDSVKLLFSDGGYDPTDEQSVRDYHPQAARLMERLFQDWLKTRKGKGDNTVVFVGGGNGSGKSTSAGGYEKASFVIDATMASLNATVFGIQQNMEAGFEPVIRFVYRDPIDAWYNGVLARRESGGHITPRPIFANAHATARKNLDTLVERFGDRIEVDVFENRNREGLIRISLAELRAKPRLAKEQILEAIDGVDDAAVAERKIAEGE